MPNLSNSTTQKWRSEVRKAELVMNHEFHKRKASMFFNRKSAAKECAKASTEFEGCLALQLFLCLGRKNPAARKKKKDEEPVLKSSYAGPIPISTAKYEDIHLLKKFYSPRNHEFFNTHPHLGNTDQHSDVSGGRKVTLMNRSVATLVLVRIHSVHNHLILIS
ncbi:hypothetical protein PoB_004499300 [Plakobranchus ocellatus]|uniref:Uncharacterized protein n=1 Tax=Plakobranchus ocellatus TaxID=259542 RepID=A0AAV4BFX0_9GAST|nr:hypothetical protein PoB_004499300 [Plakobranchus ocellatus]